MTFFFKNQLIQMPLLFLAFFYIKNIYAQNLMGGVGGKKDDLFIEGQILKTKQKSYDLGIKIPIWENEITSYHLEPVNPLITNNLS